MFIIIIICEHSPRSVTKQDDVISRWNWIPDSIQQKENYKYIFLPNNF